MIKMDIEGVVFSSKMLSELRYMQDPEITRVTLENIDTVLDYILDPAPDADDAKRLDMVTTVHNLSKFIKTLSRKEVGYEEGK